MPTNVPILSSDFFTVQNDPASGKAIVAVVILPGPRAAAVAPVVEQVTIAPGESLSLAWPTGQGAVLGIFADGSRQELWINSPGGIVLDGRLSTW